MSPSLFVGGLPPGATEHLLKSLFSGFGVITNCFIKRGYAFLNFEDPASMENAVALDGYELEGKVLGVRIQTENQKHQSQSASQMPVSYGTPTSPDGESLFIGGLPATITEEDLRQLCSIYGTVKRVSVKRGFAFVAFEEPEGPHQACALDGYVLDGRTLGVRIQSPSNMKPRDGSGGSKFGVVPQAVGGIPSLFLGGFGDATEDDIRKLVGSFGPLLNIVMHKSYAFVNYAAVGCAERAAQSLDGYIFNGRLLGARVQTERLPPRQKGAGASMLANPFGSHGSSPIVPPISPLFPSLFVGGIGPHVTERDLRVLFGIYGDVIQVVIKKGYAFIDYATAGCSEAATLALDGKNLDGKPLGVRVQDLSNSKTPRSVANVTHRYKPY